MNNIKATLNVEGMTCSHCENSVKKAVSALLGVESVQVNLEQKTVIVEYNSETVTQDNIKEAIEDQGYDVV